MTQLKQFMSSVEHIMLSPATVVSPNESTANVRTVLENNDGDPVAVVNPDYSLKGIITTDAVLFDGPSTAGQLALAPRMTVAPHESAFSVVSRMLKRRIDWVPVLRDGKLVGTISRRCVMSAFGETCPS